MIEIFIMFMQMQGYEVEIMPTQFVPCHFDIQRPLGQHYDCVLYGDKIVLIAEKNQFREDQYGLNAWNRAMYHIYTQEDIFQ